MSCVLKASGAKFDVDGFLRVHSVNPSLIWRVGETELGRPHDLNGFSVRVSVAGLDDFDGQVKEATDFVKENSAWLKQLLDYPGIEYAYLDFARKVSVHVTIPGIYFQPTLVKIVGEIGLGIQASIYYADD